MKKLKLTALVVAIATTVTSIPKDAFSSELKETYSDESKSISFSHLPDILVSSILKMAYLNTMKVPEGFYVDETKVRSVQFTGPAGFDESQKEFVNKCIVNHFKHSKNLDYLCIGGNLSDINTESLAGINLQIPSLVSYLQLGGSCNDEQSKAVRKLSTLCKQFHRVISANWVWRYDYVEDLVSRRYYSEGTSSYRAAILKSKTILYLQNLTSRNSSLVSRVMNDFRKDGVLVDKITSIALSDEAYMKILKGTHSYGEKRKALNAIEHLLVEGVQ